jgi:hypothetical protein
MEGNAISAELSRRLARLKLFEPVRDLSPEERRALFNAAHEAADFDRLPARFRDLIVAAEAAREQRRVARHPVRAGRDSAAEVEG